MSVVEVSLDAQGRIMALRSRDTTALRNMVRRVVPAQRAGKRRCHVKASIALAGCLAERVEFVWPESDEWQRQREEAHDLWARVRGVTFKRSRMFLGGRPFVATGGSRFFAA